MNSFSGKKYTEPRRILAEWAQLSIARDCVFGIIFSVILGHICFMILLDSLAEEFSSVSLFIILGILHLEGLIVFVCAGRIYRRVRHNNRKIPPISADSTRLYIYDGKEHISIPLHIICNITFKEEKYFRWIGPIRIRGYCGYGRITVYYNYQGETIGKTLNLVESPEIAAQSIRSYLYLWSQR